MRPLTLVLPVLALVLVGCFGLGGGRGTDAGDGAGSSIGQQNSGDASGTITIAGSVTMGPMCAVVATQACPDGFLEGARLVLVDAAGDEVGRVRSDSDGRFTLSLLPGEEYTLVSQPVEGLAAPRPLELTVKIHDQPAPVVLRYDTGLR